MSGSTIGIPYSPTGGYSPVSGSYGVTLARYAAIIGYSECAFFGVSDASNVNYACRSIWSKYDRDTIADYLTEAQDELENVIGYPLVPTWFTAEEHPYKTPLLLDNAKLIAIGLQTSETLGSNVAVSFVSDPATITIPTTLTSTDGISIFYPGTDIAIIPSSIQIIGGNLIIRAPKCRLLTLEHQDNPVQGWDSSDPTIYQYTVDIKRFYADTTQQASIIYDPLQCTPECTTIEEDICAYIGNAEIGMIRLGGANTATCIAGTPRRVKVNYYAGLTELSKKIEMSIVRLAHSRMPTEPCGCDITQRLWKRDRNEPVVLDRERLNCPFGTSDGAWAAWRLAISLSSFRVTDFSGEKRG